MSDVSGVGEWGVLGKGVLEEIGECGGVLCAGWGEWGDREEGEWGDREEGEWGDREEGEWGDREEGEWGDREEGEWGESEWGGGEWGGGEWGEVLGGVCGEREEYRGLRVLLRCGVLVRGVLIWGWWFGGGIGRRGRGIGGMEEGLVWSVQWGRCGCGSVGVVVGGCDFPIGKLE
jgi:hypothetical protein